MTPSYFAVQATAMKESVTMYLSTEVAGAYTADSARQYIMHCDDYAQAATDHVNAASRILTIQRQLVGLQAQSAANNHTQEVIANNSQSVINTTHTYELKLKGLMRTVFAKITSLGATIYSTMYNVCNALKYQDPKRFFTCIDQKNVISSICGSFEPGASSEWSYFSPLVVGDDSPETLGKKVHTYLDTYQKQFEQFQSLALLVRDTPLSKDPHVSIARLRVFQPPDNITSGPMQNFSLPCNSTANSTKDLDPCTVADEKNCIALAYYASDAKLGCNFTILRQGMGCCRFEAPGVSPNHDAYTEPEQLHVSKTVWDKFLETGKMPLVVNDKSFKQTGDNSLATVGDTFRLKTSTFVRGFEIYVAGAPEGGDLQKIYATLMPEAGATQTQTFCSNGNCITNADGTTNRTTKQFLPHFTSLITQEKFVFHIAKPKPDGSVTCSSALAPINVFDEGQDRGQEVSICNLDEAAELCKRDCNSSTNGAITSGASSCSGGCTCDIPKWCPQEGLRDVAREYFFTSKFKSLQDDEEGPSPVAMPSLFTKWQLVLTGHNSNNPNRDIDTPMDLLSKLKRAGLSNCFASKPPSSQSPGEPSPPPPPPSTMCTDIYIAWYYTTRDDGLKDEQCEARSA